MLGNDEGVKRREDKYSLGVEGEGGGVSKTECLHVQWDAHVRADGGRS